MYLILCIPVLKQKLKLTVLILKSKQISILYFKAIKFFVCLSNSHRLHEISVGHEGKHLR